MRAPNPHPCGSCPYRRDVPSGVWSEEEYVKLPHYDGETFTQPPTVFACHQQDGAICAGWAGCHDMQESLGLRFAAQFNLLDEAEVQAVLNYECAVPLWGSGAEAAAHGLVEVEHPGQKARSTITRLESKLWPQSGR